MQLIARRYQILATLQAIVGGLIAIVVILTYQLSPGTLRHSSLSITLAGVGMLTVIYYFSLHQMFGKKNPQLSALVINGLSALNILLVVMATGGLDSPYYSLWLLTIVVTGFYGLVPVVAIVTATAIYHLYDMSTHQFANSYVLAHAGQLIISIATGAIGAWVHRSLNQGVIVQHEKVAQLSGKLSQESLKSEALMNSVGDGVIVVNSSRQIQLFNPAAVHITGWDAASAQNLDYRLVLSLHDPNGKEIKDDNDPLLKAWESGKNFVQNDFTIDTKGGHKLPVTISISPIFDGNKKISGGIALFRDISAEKEAERQRNEFISTASHEMRTPVAAVEGYLSLAMNPTVATIDDRAKGFLEKAHAATQHLGELFRDLLTATKIEDTGKFDSVEVLDLTQLIKEIASDMQFAAQKKKIELQFGADGQKVRGEHAILPVYAVRGNAQRLREVTTNLVDNAIKYTNAGTVHVSIGGTDEVVSVSVADSGIGISPEDAGHLFQKFYRVDSSSTRTIGGTGLGLYLCRKIIELLGGRIWVESKKDEGSTFKFTLPRANSADIVKPEEKQPVVIKPGMKVT